MNGFGAAILAVFGGIWCVVGLKASGRVSSVWCVVPVVVSLGIIAAYRRLQKTLERSPGSGPSPEEARRAGRAVGIASATEGVLIFVAINVLNNLGRGDLATPVVAIIVGLHFVPLARGLRFAPYYATGAGLVLVGILGWGLRDVGTRVLFVGVGAAAVLWLSSVRVLLVLRTRARAAALPSAV